MTAFGIYFNKTNSHFASANFVLYLGGMIFHKLHLSSWSDIGLSFL